MPSLDITCDEDDPNQAGLLAATESQLVPTTVPDGVRGDIQVYCAIKTVKFDGVGLFYSHLSTDTYILAIGNPDEPSTAGEANFLVNATAANSIPYNATAAQFQTIFSAASVTAGFGSVVVTKLATGSYQLDWSSNGAVVDGTITDDSSELIPASQIVISPISEGSASSKAQYVIQWKQQPVALAAPTTEFPVASVTESDTQTATYTRNKIVKVSFSEGVAAGNFSVSATILGVTEGVGTANPSMSAQDFGLMLSNHSLVKYLEQDGTVDNIIATKSGSIFYVEFIGTLAGSTLRKNVTSSSIANPSVITTSANHNFADGDMVTFTNHITSVPDINGSQGPITVISDTTFSIPVNVTTGGTGGKVFNNTEPYLSVNNIDLTAPKGVYGTIGLNTINLAKAFFAQESTVTELVFTLSIKRTRLSGEERTLLLVPMTVKRSLIDLSALVDMPTVLSFLFRTGDLAVTGAGTTEIVVPANCKFYTLYVAISAFSGTRNIDLSSTGRTAGDKCMVVLGMPAGTAPTIHIRDNDSAGTIWPEIGSGSAYVRPVTFTYRGTDEWTSDQGSA